MLVCEKLQIESFVFFLESYKSATPTLYHYFNKNTSEEVVALKSAIKIYCLIL